MTSATERLCEHLKADGKPCTNPASFYRNCAEGTTENLCATHANYEQRHGADIIPLRG